MPSEVKVNGSYKNVAGVSTKVNGAWKDVAEAYTKVNGVWRIWLKGDVYWIAISGNSNYQQGKGVSTDSNGNIYFVADGETTDTVDRIIISKYDTEGVIQWQRSEKPTGSFNLGSDITVDANDDIYFTGSDRGSGSDRAVVFKYNNNGNREWARDLQSSGNENGRAISVSSDRVYVGINSSQNDVMKVAVYDLNGTFLRDAAIGGSGICEFGGMRVISNTEILISGFTNNDNFFTQKLNGTQNSPFGGELAEVWNTFLEDGRAEGGVDVDSSGNVIAAGRSFETGTRTAFLAKLNSSGSSVWQRSFGGANFEYIQGVTTDSQDNIYIVANSQSTSIGTNYVGLVMKFNSSGTLQWQREFGGSGSNTFLQSIDTDPSDNLVINGYTEVVGQGSEEIITAKLPNDGSATGTYSFTGGSIIYQNANQSIVNENLTAARDSVNVFTSSLSGQNNISPIRQTSLGFTNQTVEIG